MPKGKPWSPEEETKLKQLIALGQSLESIASQMGKTPNAIYQKCLKLCLVVKEENHTAISSSITLPRELPSVEEALKILAGALKASSKAGLDRVEVQRLQVIATLARTFTCIKTNKIERHRLPLPHCCSNPNKDSHIVHIRSIH